MSLSLVAGTTSKSIGIFIGDSSVTTGAGLTGLVFNTANLVAYYFQPRITGATAITLATLAGATAAWGSGGFVEIDATNMPGWYRLDIPNAALTGATSVCIGLKGATNMRPVQVEIELTAWNNQDAVRGGMTALPNANAAASGGLLINGSNTGTVTLAALTISGAVLLSSTLTVSAATTFASLAVTTTTVLGGAVTLSSTLAITGAFTTTNAGNDIRGVLVNSTSLSSIAAAVRDVSNATPAANSLGEAVNEGSRATYGAFPITVTVVDGSAVALENALVWISDGVTAVSDLTDVSGNATFSFNAGTYTVGITKAGYSFASTTRTVTGSQAGTLVNNLAMAAVNVPPSPPADPAKGTIFGNIVRSDASSPAGIAITATLKSQTGNSLAYSVGNMLVPVVQSTTTDGNGDWEIDLFGNDDITPAGTYWLVEIPAANFTANVILAGGEVKNIDALIV